MKSSILLVLLLTSISSILKSEEIDVLFNANDYPFEFINIEGNPDGFNVDLIYAVAREASLTINLKEGNWKTHEEQLFNGHIDLTPRYFSKNENDYIINSDILYSIYLSLVYNKDSPIKETSDLKNKILVLTSGNSSEQAIIQQNYSSEFIRTKVWSDSIKALSIGYGDYSVISTIQYRQISEQYKETLEEQDSFNLILPFGFSAAKWNKNTINSINNGISIIKVSGEFDRIYRKWFGNMENLLIKKSDSLNRTSIYILAAVFLAVAILFSFNKRKV